MKRPGCPLLLGLFQHCFQPSQHPHPGNSSGASASAPGQHADQHPTASERLHTQQGPTVAPGMSSSNVERLKGMSQLVRSDKTWSTGEGNGKPLQYSCLENPMNSMKGQKEHWKMSPPRLVGVQYATGEEQRNSSTKSLRGRVKAETTPSCGCV